MKKITYKAFFESEQAVSLEGGCDPPDGLTVGSGSKNAFLVQNKRIDI